MRRKKFAICFKNVRMKKLLVRKHARSEAPLDERCAMIYVIDLAIMSYVLPGAFVVQQKLVLYDEATASYE